VLIYFFLLVIYFCGFCLEIVVGDLQIVLKSNFVTVAEPRTDDVSGMLTSQFCLSGRPKVLEQLWILIHGGEMQDSFVLCDQSAMRHPVSLRNHEFFAVSSQFKT